MSSVVKTCGCNTRIHMNRIDALCTLFLSLLRFVCRCRGCVRYTQTDRMIWMVFGASFHFHFHFSMCTHRYTHRLRVTWAFAVSKQSVSRTRVALVRCLCFALLQSSLVGGLVGFCSVLLLLLLFACSLIVIFRVAPCVCIVYSISCNLRVIASNEWMNEWKLVWPYDADEESTQNHSM